MFLVCLAGLALFLSQANAGQPYTRVYLRSNKQTEMMRIEDSFVSQAVGYIEEQAMEASKKGLTSYTVPFEGCEEYVKRNEYRDDLSVVQCKKVIARIYTTIRNDFPDSYIIHEKGSYTLSWA
jgi:hypothetical protein